eukprot:758348-Hanusia_phi.AAC.1
MPKASCNLPCTVPSSSCSACRGSEKEGRESGGRDRQATGGGRGGRGGRGGEKSTKNGSSACDFGEALREILFIIVRACARRSKEGGGRKRRKERAREEAGRWEIGGREEAGRFTSSRILSSRSSARRWSSSLGSEEAPGGE